MAGNTVRMPGTVKEATAELNGLGVLLTAKEWHRAAIVRAFTEKARKGGAGGGMRKPKNRLPLDEFAKLGITGLTSPETVGRYYDAWEKKSGKPTPKPGEKVTLPTKPFPPTPLANGATLPGAVERSFRELAKKDPAVVGRLVEDPKVRRKVEKAIIDADGIEETPGQKAMAGLADSLHEADRITGPLGCLRGVLWNTARKIAEVPRPRKTERVDLVETANEMRMYADEFESLGTDSIDSGTFASWVAELEEEEDA